MGSTIEKAGTLQSGNYALLVLKANKTHVCLIFDSVGTFLEEKTRPAGPGNAIDIASLSSTITSYISNNYAGATILKAFKNTASEITVVLKKTDGTHVAVGFAADGSFKAELALKAKGLGKGTNVAIADLPAAITSYVSSNYSGAVIIAAYQAADGKYGILINKADNTKVMLGFNADNSFIGVLPNPGGKK